MTKVKDIKDLAQQKMDAVVEALAKQATEGDIPSARLLAEIAGSIVKSGPGRPSHRRIEEEPEPTPAEIKTRTEEANEILEKYGDRNVQGS